MKHTLIKFSNRQCSSIEISHDPSIQLEILGSKCLLLYSLFIVLLVPRDKSKKKKQLWAQGVRSGKKATCSHPAFICSAQSLRDKKGKRKAWGVGRVKEVTCIPSLLYFLHLQTLLPLTYFYLSNNRESVCMAICKLIVRLLMYERAIWSVKVSSRSKWGKPPHKIFACKYLLFSTGIILPFDLVTLNLIKEVFEKLSDE